MEQATLDMDDKSPLATAVASFHGEHRFLSNFWPAVVYLDGDAYPTVEHAYVAAKTDDTVIREQIRHTESPGDVKRLGRELQLSPGFDDRKLQVMEDLLRQKFVPGSALSRQLMATGDRVLVEGNRWGDTFWGICRGKGENHLGKILMKIRKDLVQLQSRELSRPQKTRRI